MGWGTIEFIVNNWAPILLAAGLAGVSLYAWWAGRRHRRALEKNDRQYALAKREHERYIQAQFQAQQEALFNSMVEGVLVLDPQARIRLCNQSLRLLLHFSRDIRGLTILEAFRLHELDALARGLLEECKIIDRELELPGTPSRQLQVNGSAVLDRDGKQLGAILVFHDLTRIKQLENTRQEFVANVSHELRTPLSMIKGFVETLLNGAMADPAVSTRFLNNISKHTDRLTFLIEDLLTISRLESGKVVFNLLPTGIHEVAMRVIDDLRSRAAEKKIVLSNRVPADLVAWADGDRLQQVLFNLVDNAIKYGTPAGHVEVVALPSEKDFVLLSVQDDGPGIPPESKDRVFERFYRVDKARSREQGGTGLGLSIVKHIVQCHGGRVWVESEPGKGAKFFFTLPLGPTASEPEAGGEPMAEDRPPANA